MDIMIPYSGLILMGEIFMDWIVKTFRGYIFKYSHEPDHFFLYSDG